MRAMDTLIAKYHQARVVSQYDLKLRSVWTKPIRYGKLWAGGVCASEDETGSFSGFAVDKSMKMMVLKSIMEMFEQIAHADANREEESRTGMAAYTDEKNAKLGAYQELIERDALMYHWLTEKPGRSIRLENIEFMNFLPKGLAEKTNLRVVELETADPGYFAALAGAPSGHGCWMMGCGAATDIDSAVKKALTEWVAIFYRHDVWDNCPAQVDSDNRDSKTDLSVYDQHHFGTKDSRNSALIQYILEGEDPWRRSRHNRRSYYYATEFDQLPTRSEQVYVFLGKNPHLIPLRFGKNFDENYSFYRNHLDSTSSLPKEFRYHGEDHFLKHPID